MIPDRPSQARNDARVLVASMFFAPCKEVGGKRFSFLSRYLAPACSEYHVLARQEREAVTDPTAFSGNVHRCRMLPWFPPLEERGLKYRLLRIWAKWICQIDPYIGWVVPAAFSGLRLVRRHRLNVVVVTIPAFSGIIAALLISRATGTRLVIDYRDEWTNLRTTYRRPFGRILSRALERAAVKRAAAIVLCTDVMRRDFERSFGDIATARLAVIYNGLEREESSPRLLAPEVETNMVYAGTLYGNRQLSLIAPSLRELLEDGTISARSFRFHVFTRLSEAQREELRTEGLNEIVYVHDPVSYAEIRRVLKGADILFLPSGDEVDYAVPFKFFDYLNAKKPILTVASRQSAIRELMNTVDCGVFAELGNHREIAAALRQLVARERVWSFDGVDRYLWQNAAARYERLLREVVAA